MFNMSNDIVSKIIELKKGNVLSDKDWEFLSSMSIKLEGEKDFINLIDFMQSDNEAKEKIIMQIQKCENDIHSYINKLLVNQNKDFFKDEKKTDDFFSSILSNDYNALDKAFIVSEVEDFFEDEDFRKICSDKFINSSGLDYQKRNILKMVGSYNALKIGDQLSDYLSEEVKKCIFSNPYNKLIFGCYFEYLRGNDELEKYPEVRDVLREEMANRNSNKNFSYLLNSVSNFIDIGKTAVFVKFMNVYKQNRQEDAFQDLYDTSKFYKGLVESNDDSIVIDEDFENILFGENSDILTNRIVADLVDCDIVTAGNSEEDNRIFYKLLSMDMDRKKVVSNYLDPLSSNFSNIEFVNKICNLDKDDLSFTLKSKYEKLMEKEDLDEYQNSTFSSAVVGYIANSNNLDSLNGLKDIMNGNTSFTEGVSQFMKNNKSNKND